MDRIGRIHFMAKRPPPPLEIQNKKYKRRIISGFKCTFRWFVVFFVAFWNAVIILDIPKSRIYLKLNIL